jgi:uncharacterized cofD-like protein
VGRIVPATDGPVSLKARLDSGEVLGQAAMARTASIRTVEVVPPDATAAPTAVSAVLEADQIVLGPGSLYTSVLAVTAVTGISNALRATRARRVYVCNLRPQRPETAGFGLGEHLEALAAHGVEPDVVVVDPRWLPERPGGLGAGLGAEVIEASVGRDDGVAHDPVRLAAVLADLVG